MHILSLCLLHYICTAIIALYARNVLARFYPEESEKNGYFLEIYFSLNLFLMYVYLYKYMISHSIPINIPIKSIFSKSNSINQSSA